MKRLGCPLAILLSLNVRTGSCATEAEIASGPPAAHKDQTFTDFFRRTSGWVAGDGALSVPLPDGRVLWLFGDSHVDDFDPASGTIPCLFQTRNAALLHQTNDLRNARMIMFDSFFFDDASLSALNRWITLLGPPSVAPNAWSSLI